MTTLEAVPAVDPPASTSRPRRRGHAARWAAAMIAVLSLLLVGLLATRPPAATRVAASPLLGLPAPPVEGPTFSGETASLAALRGKWVLVNFFATWCAPCREEHDDLVAFARTHDRRGDAKVLSVLYDRDDGEAAKQYFAEHGGTWPVVDSRSANVDFGVRGVPESFLIAPDGTVTLRIIGGIEVGQLEALLARVQERLE
ncbi:MAG TPA: TlpA disulfide reductase family protein [Acidimicrobiales bacterium]|nr:TlpA disulfide reductase family protein [Acidimicrobiales bacterium]